MNTEQFNLRISKGIIFDLEFISRVVGIDKTDWVRFKLAEAIRSEKEKLIEQVESDFVKARIDDAEFKRLTGYGPSAGIVRIQASYKKRFENTGKHTLFAKKGLMG